MSLPLGLTGRSNSVNCPVFGVYRAIFDSLKATIHRLPSRSLLSRRGALKGVLIMVTAPVSGSTEAISSVCMRATQAFPSGVMSMP